ncbi:transglycosylase SLT domain-containing protein [Roseibacterium sp. KMU-115]|uniref:Transglycosylase SLT domain-containing protein n=2 Tax=Roseicyclus persicicus TaxID=2650661 RepID=A0A7X6GYC6_9RHOB|nr:transglycosylase SLT domain-containing protein [Roseibacterium persicicum]NKX44679.1 transglycosylase SLT domain-containing protein [Roseibacterium persicicum]
MLPSMSSRNVPEDGFAMRWDHVPASSEWEQAGFAALDTYAAVLPEIVPADIEAWCPGYPDASEEERAAFWLGLLSSLARHESTWNEQAVGGGGQWFGLVQISPATARHYGCQATSGAALLDGAANVSCALRIWSETVPRDGVVATGTRGVAADWGPMHPSQAQKREDIRAWMLDQPYCQG